MVQQLVSRILRCFFKNSNVKAPYVGGGENCCRINNHFTVSIVNVLNFKVIGLKYFTLNTTKSKLEQRSISRDEQQNRIRTSLC